MKEIFDFVLKIVLLVAFTLLPLQGLAESFFKDLDCTIVGKQKTESQDKVQVFMDKNATACDKICTKPLTNLDPITKTNINQELLLSCFDLCQDKIPLSQEYSFTAQKKKLISGNINTNITDPDTKVVYPINRNYYNVEYDTSPVSMKLTSNNQNEDHSYFDLGQASEVRIQLNTKADNTIFTCGAKDITLTPVFPNLYEMTPGSLEGGNTEQLSINLQEDIKSPLQNSNYVGLESFPYSEYTKNFPPTGDFQKDFANLTCNYYKSLVAYGEEKGSCQEFVTKAGLKSSLCNSCQKPGKVEQVRLKLLAGKMKCNDVVEGVSVKDICATLDLTTPFVFPSNSTEALKFYSNITEVQLKGGKFLRSGWSNSNQESAWDSNNRKYHPCLASNDLTGQELNNQKLTNLPNNYDSQALDINLKTQPQTVGCYPNFHIYQDSSMDLGIKVSDGDYLSLTWTGDFIFGDGITMPFLNQEKLKLLTIGAIPSQPLAVEPKVLLDWISTITFDGLNPLIGESGKKPAFNDPLINNDSCMANLSRKLNTLGKDSSDKWYGLEGSIMRKNIFPKNKDKNNPCKSVYILNDSYNFNGILRGIGQKVPLKIKPFYFHPKLTSIFAKSIITGGQQIKVNWRGCPIRNGEKLQIAFTESRDSEPQWLNLQPEKWQRGITFLRQNSTETIVGEKIIPESARFILFRVSSDNNSKSQGSYDLLIDPVSYQTTPDFTKIIPKQIFATLIGDINSLTMPDKPWDGVLVKLTKIMQKNFIPIAQAALVMALIFYSFSFMLGTIRINQQEFIFRVIKLSVVGLILGEKTWAWFVDTFIRLFIVGPFTLALEIQNYLHRSLKIPLYTDIFDLFSVMRIVDFILQATLWHKILALVFSSIAGLVLAIVVIVIIIMLFKMTIDALMVLTSALITQGMLLLISPFFILFKAFEYTKEFFDSWAKQVIAFALIPTVATLAVSLGNIITFGLLKSVFNISYCYVPITWPFIGVQMFDLYKPILLSTMHFSTAGNFSLPMTLAIGILSLIFLSTIVWNLIGMVIGMVTRIITFKIETMGKESMSGIAQTATSGIYDPKNIEKGFKQGAKHGVKRAAVGTLQGLIPTIASEAMSGLGNTKQAEKIQKAKKDFKSFRKDFDKLQ